MYTHTDMGALVLNSYPSWPGACGMVTRGRHARRGLRRLVRRALGIAPQDREGPMAYATGRTGTYGRFPGKPVCLLTPVGLR
jgi:hypothetical protein